MIGIKDALKGEQPCGFVVLKSGVNRSPLEIEKEIVQLEKQKRARLALIFERFKVQKLLEVTKLELQYYNLYRF